MVPILRVQHLIQRAENVMFGLFSRSGFGILILCFSFSIGDFWLMALFLQLFQCARASLAMFRHETPSRASITGGPSLGTLVE